VSVLLADGNVLVALTVSDHVHQRAVADWFELAEPDLATCPITQGTLLRFLLREGQSAATAIGVLDEIRAQPWHCFWPDDVEYLEEHLVGVIGHRQVTDAYLVVLARAHGGSVVTLDRGLAALHGDGVTLLEV